MITDNKVVAAAWLTLMWSAILVVDNATGPHFSLNAVYLAPLCFTVWCLGRIAGLVSGLIVIAVTLHLNGFGDGLSAQASTVSTSTAAWNAGVRVFGVLLSFCSSELSAEPSIRSGQTPRSIP